ncbi:MAG: hypothetical protein MI702_05210 [Chlorobiales bacterium]|nr:hypothetical protein [Chlorobiales bacterium]
MTSLISQSFSAPVVLFPTINLIRGLRGFYGRFEDRKAWFVAFSQTLALLVFYWLHYNTEKLSFYVDEFLIGLLGFALVIIYIFINDMVERVFTDGYANSSRYTRDFVIQLIIYCLFLISFTYSFNMFIIKLDHVFVKGRVILEDSELPASYVEFKIEYSSGSSHKNLKTTIKCDEQGKFSRFFSSDIKPVYIKFQNESGIEWDRTVSKEAFLYGGTIILRKNPFTTGDP